MPKSTLAGIDCQLEPNVKLPETLESMRILVTNDDGILAPGLSALEAVARELAGPDGEVWTVAPTIEQSGTAHCTSFAQPMRLEAINSRRIAVNGTPADCVIAGIHEVMKAQPDLVLAGINRGNNAGENVLYSGTVGAAMEAALQGTKSIALSQFFGPGNRDLADPFEASRAHSVGLVRTLLNASLWDSEEYRLFYNVNFPPCPADKVEGTRIARQGFRRGTKFTVKSMQSPSGRQFLFVHSGSQFKTSAIGTDVHANLSNFISITPMRADLTAHEKLEDLRVNLQ